MKYAKESQALILAGSILVAGLTCAIHSGGRSSSVNQAFLRSEVASECLKEEASYDTLQAAVSAARYRIYADEKTGNAFYANNSAEQLTAYFMPDAARITVKHNANSDSLKSEAIERAKTEAPSQRESHLRLRFIGAGYGDAVRRAQGEPAITTAQDRLTYTHQLTSNHDSTGGWLSLFAKSAFRNRQPAIIEEWYVNKAEGLEHGFTISKPVDQRSEGELLKLELELSGGLIAQVAQAGKAIVFKNKDGGPQLGYAGLKAYDASGRDLAAHMSVKDAVLSFEVDDANAVYPITIDPTFTQQQKLVAGTSASTAFGLDVAISGDTAVVSAPLDDVGANTAQGSIYVFVRSGTTWSQQARLFANDGGADDKFGSSVAISANTIVAGAPNDDIGANPNQGSAYVFVRSGTTWTQQAKLTGFVSADDGFGYDVTIDGDYAAISAKGATFLGIEGFVFVFHRVGTTWTREEELPGEVQERAADDKFGESIALSGNTIVIGAPAKKTPVPTPNPCPPPIICGSCVPDPVANGAVHIMVRNGTTWSVQQTINGNFAESDCPNHFLGDRLGSSVSISGNSMVIGSSGASVVEVGTNVGKLSIWVRSGTSWTSQYDLSGINDDQQIGRAVAIDGNTVVYSSSGSDKVLLRSGTNWSLQQDLLVGGNFFFSKLAISSNTVIAAASKIFVRSGTTWSEQTELVPQEGGVADEFGDSVAIDADTAVVGVPFKNVGTASNQGSVFVFKRSGSTWEQEAQLTASDGAANHRFGDSVAIEGDTIAVGASQPFASQGAVYVFTRSGANWTQQTKIIAADGQGLDLFGQSVALSGNSLVVGSPLEESTGGDNNGSAYVFTGSGATWTQQAKLRAIEEANGDQFGYDVDVDGDTIAVGARFVDNGANTLQGAAYVFTRTGTTWAQQARLLASDGVADDHFGESLSVSGNTLAVGCAFHNIGANSNQGAVYLFNRSGSAWTETQILTANDGATDDTFGISVALQSVALLVGASGDDFASANAQGSAYVFIPFGATWTQVQKLSALDGAANDNFGNAVALHDRTFLVGAHWDDVGSTVDQGSAYVIIASGGAVWTGASSANWSNANNWDSTVVPNALDDVTIPSSGVTNEAVLNVNAQIRDLTIEAGRSLTINAGRTLTVNGDLTVTGTIVGGGTLVFNGASFINNNSANVANVRFGVGVKQLSGTGLFFGNTVTVLSGSTLQLSSNHTMNRLVVNSGGTLNITSTNIMSLLGSGVALTNNGSITGAGAVSFDGTSAQSTSGNVGVAGLTINNPAGVTLGANATVSGVLNLTSGDLSSGAFTLTMPATATSTGTTDVIGNVKRTGFTTANTLSFGNPFNTIRFTSGTPPTDVTVNLVKQAPSDFTNATLRTYTITPNGGGGFAATLRLHYQDSERNGNAEPTLGLWRKGATWTNLGATTRNATDNWVELAGIGQFSPWVISGPAAPTAVEFSGATATQFDDATLVEWQTGFEVSNLGFNLYRDENGKRTLVNPQLIAGSALVAGSNTAMTAGRSYAWIDMGARSTDAAYWLEDVDTNGQSTWHGPVGIARSSGQLIEHKIQQATLLSALGRQQPAPGQAQFTPVERVVSLPLPAASGSLQKEIAAAQAVKLDISQEGWYRLSRDELLAAGLASDGDPRKLQLILDGAEQPMLVVGKESGSFESFEAIEFYGVGTDSPYSNRRTYWLVAGNQPGRRVPVINTKPESKGAANFPYTVERKERSIYFSSLLNGDAENWFGGVVTSNGIDQPITIRSLDEAPQNKAELEIALQGVTSLAANLDHQVQVRVNGQFVGCLFFDGREHEVDRFDVPLATLKEGENLVTLTAAGNTSDTSLVDYVRLTYPHRYTADGDALKLTTAASFTSQQIDGFTSNEIRVFDVTEAGQIRELTGVIVPASKNSFSVAVDTGQPDRTLLALTASQFKKPESITAGHPSSLRDVGNKADFLIITRQDWAGALEPLKTLRQKQGLVTMIVDIDDVFDEFSFGQKTPYAVRAFLSYTHLNWSRKPRFVLFAGDASIDPRNHTGFGETDFVPTKLVHTAFLETASDDWLADFNNDGYAEIAAGRLPIRNATEAAALVNKLLRYEVAPRSAELTLFADLNEGYDFESASLQLRALVPSSLRVQEIFRSRNSDAATKDMLLDAIQRGQTVVNYSGHGSVTNWRGNMLTTDDARSLTNANRLPLLVMMNCLNGYFGDPSSESLAEALIRNEQGGAIAVWASSGMTLANEQASMNRQLFRTMFSEIALTVGEHISFAKLATADADARRSWILFGDPTMRTR